MLEPVFICQKDGQFVSESTYVAWYGFSKMGHETHFTDDWSLESVDLPSDAIVIGGAREVERAFKRLHITHHEPDAIPGALLPFAGRKLWTSTIGDIMTGLIAGTLPPTFVKPTPVYHKYFTGFVAQDFNDTLAIMHLKETMPCVCSEPVEFRSEWRCFVHRKKVLNISHYIGDPLTFPDTSMVTAMIDAWTDQPVAYALDVGIVADGRTLPVEVNDCLSLGVYGLYSYGYAQMIRDRWRELRGVIA